MSGWRRGNRFTSLRGAQNKAKRFWTCRACLWRVDKKPGKGATCAVCNGELLYFQSEREADRYAQLRQWEHAGIIWSLQPKPKFPVVINDQKCFTYEADFLYFGQSGLVVEDVKGTLNPKGHDPVFKLKAKIVEAYHGITITVVK